MTDESKLRQLVQVFLIENQKLNLSAFRTEEHCWTGNVLDSIALLSAFEGMRDHPVPKRLLDLGTGGGFPLLPLAICLPETQCIGVDSTAKKIEAVGHIATELGLMNVTLINGRSEELAHQTEHRAMYDLVTARAVAPIAVLLEYAIPFLKVGGLCAFWKSSKVAEELANSVEAQKALHAPFGGTYEYELPDGFGKRLIVFFKKTAGTPKEYPREVGVPKSKPL